MKLPKIIDGGRRVLTRAGTALVRRPALLIIVLAFGAHLFKALVFGLTFWCQPVDPVLFRQGYPESHRLYDRDGVLLREAVGPGNAPARWTGWDGIPREVVDATLACEDDAFFEHGGVDPRALLRAFSQNLSGGRVVSGASTIDMQLGRLIWNRPHDLFGKILQMHDALRLNLYLDKRTILLNYLNRAPYGANLTGIETASRTYFNKPARLLSLAEAAYLAGIPQSPVRLDPTVHPEETRRRQEFVLKRLADTGTISEAELQAALRERIVVRAARPAGAAMHFTDYVLAQHPDAGDIHTTLHGRLNEQIENIIRNHVDVLEQGGLTNAACVVLDNADGSMLAMVGSADYWNSDGGMVNGALALRQPGSTLKPFLYALAFENGWSPISILPDVRTEYLGTDRELYVPENYTRTFHGPVPAKAALTRSLNVPAVYLTNEVGVFPLLTTLRRAGLRSLDQTPAHYGLGLILGDGEVTLLELTAAFALFPRQGLTVTPYAFLRRGQAPPPPGERLFDERTCFLISHILSDENLRYQAYGYSNPLIMGFPVAVKTGTSSNWCDNWVVGYTDHYTIGVWAGDFRGNPMNQLSGIIGAGPLFNKIARLVVAEGPYRDFPSYPAVPEGVESVRVCQASGLAATALCPETMTAFIPARDRPLPPCDVHRRVRLDKRNGLLASNKCPARYVEEKTFAFLPPRYAAWQKESGLTPPPTRASPLSAEGYRAVDALVVTTPRNGDIFLIEPGYDRSTQSIRLAGEVDPPLPDVDWLVDGEKVARARWPYTALWRLKKGKHSVQMARGAAQSDKIWFEVR